MSLHVSWTFAVLKDALVLLYSTETLVSLPIKMFFNRLRGFLPMITALSAVPPAKGLLYFTSLCASVATKVTSVGAKLQNTPDITGRRSSLATAKMVLLIAAISMVESISS